MQPTPSVGAILLLGSSYKPFPVYHVYLSLSGAADGYSFGGWGTWSARLFRVHSARFVNARGAGSRRARVRGAGVVRPPVVREARGAGVVRRPVVRMARRAARDRVPGVVPPHARCAGVIACSGWFCRTPIMPRGSVLGWCAYAEQANDGGQPAEPIVAADRCAREIVAFLTSSCAARARPAELHRWTAAYHHPCQTRT